MESGLVQPAMIGAMTAEARQFFAQAEDLVCAGSHEVTARWARHEIRTLHPEEALAMLDVDPQGFDVMDRKLLEAVIHRFDGGPVGLDNVAASIGEERDTIEDVIEPYLIQQGYLQRTPRGRIATMAAYRHLGVTPPRPEGGLFDGQ